MTLTYNLDPNEAWERHHDYQKVRGYQENLVRMLCPVQPGDLLDEDLHREFKMNEWRLERLALQPKKEST